MKDQTTEMPSLSELATGIAILTALCSLISLVSNVFVFAGWGLNFASVASPTDIVIGGVASFRILLFPCLVILFAFLLSKALKNSASEFVQNYKALIVLLSILFAYLYLAHWVYAVGLIYGKIQIIKSDHLLFNFLILGVLSFFDFLRPQRKYLRKEFPVLIFGAFVLTSLLSTFSLAQRGQGDLVVEVDGSPCEEQDHVVWLGSNTAVVSCNSSPFRPEYFYRIVERDGLVFETHRNESEEWF